MQPISLTFDVERSDARCTSRLSTGNGKTAETEFEYERDSRLARVIDAIESNDCEFEDICDVGSQLWANLTSGDVGELLRKTIDEYAGKDVVYQCRLKLSDVELERLPWESFYDPDRGCLASDLSFCVVREPPKQIPKPSHDQQEGGQLNLLVVIPEGSRLQVEYERNNIDQTVAPWRDRLRVETLYGRVTPDRLSGVLEGRTWDVVHFIGHGETDDKGRVSIRLNDETQPRGEFWIDAETFASLFKTSTVRLVILNCCLGATPSPSFSLSGMGPFLLREGIPAVVAMRYDIPDAVAIQFAKAFYSELLNGQEPGRVDMAMERARRTIFINKRDSTARGFVTPVLYLAPGCERLFTLKASSQPASVVSQPVLEMPEEFDDLLEALSKGECIPVIGPGIYSAGTNRSETTQAGPRALAEKLAAQCQYPQQSDFEIRDRAGEWMDTILLEWVCQHFVSTKKRFRLTRAVLDFYEEFGNTQILEPLGLWYAPAIIYTHFDGLVERTLTHLRKDFRVVNPVGQNLDITAGERVLVNFRGSLSDPDSLVLTEDDHDDLWNRLSKMNSQVVDLVHGYPGRSVVFLGIDPRDRLVRRFSSLILDPSKVKNRGPLYFVVSDWNEVDATRWKKYEVTWIKASIDQILESLASHVGEEASR